jgi:hypothetical protein
VSPADLEYLWKAEGASVLKAHEQRADRASRSATGEPLAGWHADLCRRSARAWAAAAEAFLASWETP